MASLVSRVDLTGLAGSMQQGRGGGGGSRTRTEETAHPWGGMYVLIVLSHLCREENFQGRRVAPLPPPQLFPRVPRLVCEKILEAWFLMKISCEIELEVKRKKGSTSA